MFLHEAKFKFTHQESTAFSWRLTLSFKQFSVKKLENLLPRQKTPGSSGAQTKLRTGFYEFYESGASWANLCEV